MSDSNRYGGINSLLSDHGYLPQVTKNNSQMIDKYSKNRNKSLDYYAHYLIRHVESRCPLYWYTTSSYDDQTNISTNNEPHKSTTFFLIILNPLIFS
jgi:hypothetical protein